MARPSAQSPPGGGVRQPWDGYFDAAAGLPLHPVALEALNAAAGDGWADPAKLSAASRRSARLLDAAREAVAAELDAHPDEIAFLSSGIQAAHAAVLGAAAGRTRAGEVLVHSAVEHSAVLHAVGWHTDRGGSAKTVPVDQAGRVDADRFLAAAVRPGVAAAVLQAANHEVGTRQPVDAVIRGLAEAAGGPADRVPLVVDASQTVPYEPLPRDAPVCFADARTWGGPGGVGILVVRRGTRWTTPFPAESAEGGRSAGVPDVPAIVAAAASLRAFRAEATDEAVRLRGLTSRIAHQLTGPGGLPDAILLGDQADRLPHLVTLSLLYLEGQPLLDKLEAAGFTVSSGSSCTSDTLTPSHVLVAMGALTSGNLRISLHPGVTEAAVEEFVRVLPGLVAQTRAELPGAPGAFAAGPYGAGSYEAGSYGAGSYEARNLSTPVIDARGRRCPLPVLDLARAIPAVRLGGELIVLADDPAAESDIAAWCRMRGQQLLDIGPTPPREPDAPPATAYRVRRLA